MYISEQRIFGHKNLDCNIYYYNLDYLVSNPQILCDRVTIKTCLK